MGARFQFLGISGGNPTHNLIKKPDKMVFKRQMSIENDFICLIFLQKTLDKWGIRGIFGPENPTGRCWNFMQKC